MMFIRSLLFSMVFAPLIAANAAVTATGNDATAIGKVMGNANFNSNNSTTITTTTNNNISQTRIIQSYPSSKLNSLEKKQEALLVATNPTKLDLVGASFNNWVSDGEPFLSLVLSNTSGLPASALKITCQLDYCRDHTLTRNKTFDVSQYKNYVIEASQSRKIPIFSISDVKKIINLSDADCIYGASDSPGLGILDAEPDFSIQGSSQVHSIGLPVGYSFDSIFEQRFERLTSVYVLIANKKSDYVVLNKKRVPLECL